MVPLGEVALSTRIEGAGTERNPRRCVPLLGVRVPLRRTTYQIFHMRLPWDKWSFCLTTARMAGDQERYCVQRQAFYDVSICTTPTCIDSERARFVNGLLNSESRAAASAEAAQALEVTQVVSENDGFLSAVALDACR